LHPSAASININKSIWDVYFDKLLALFAAPGDDGNYEATAASDLVCLQVKVPLLCNFSFVLYNAANDQLDTLSCAKSYIYFFLLFKF
jgi:hypothetical protein